MPEHEARQPLLIGASRKRAADSASSLSEQEVVRLQNAAKQAGMPWLPMLDRPRTARQFIERVESEQRRTN